MDQTRSVFSRIIDGELPAEVVWSDATAVAFLSVAPVTDGHALVVPREAVDQFVDADDALLAHLSSVAAAVGRAQRAAWAAPRVGVVVAGFEVPHLHLHVLPLFHEGQVRLDAARTDVPAAEIAAAADRLRAALRAAGHGGRVDAA